MRFPSLPLPLRGVAILAALCASLPALACDAAALRRQLTEASPIAVPGVFVKLAACDARAARAAAAKAIPRGLPGEEGAQAAVAALGVGADEPVRTWLSGMQADQRADLIDRLGRACGEEPAVADFLVGGLEKDAERFWSERWYRGLADCRTSRVQSLLTEAVAEVDGLHDRGQFFGILEVYARNLRADAVPRLEQLVGELETDRDRQVVVGAFADAAGVGAPGGIDAEAARRATQALERLGPVLEGESVDRGRDTLYALGASAAADRFVQHRWPDRLKEGRYTYQVAAHELVTCKNGKQQAVLHHGLLREPAARWPDALASDLEETLRKRWQLGAAAKKCKGTSQVTVAMTPEPVDGADDTWLDAQREAFRARAREAHKASEQAREPLSL